jgi:hypothetical protein
MVTVIMAKLGAPSVKAQERFADAGMKGVHAHGLTESERVTIEKAIESLPELHRQVLSERLRSLSFVDGVPGEGTGLTSRSEDGQSYDITLRASLITESLSKFLTTKERRVFEGRMYRDVVVRGDGVNALTYVFLHEATHVVDAVLGLTRDTSAPLERGVWIGRTAPDARYCTELALKTRFRGMPPLATSDADNVYRSLSRTPFVSLYSTASASEDLAELVSWYVVRSRHRGKLVVTVRTSSGRVIERFEPMNFPLVRARYADVERLLSKGLPLTAASLSGG